MAEIRTVTTLRYKRDEIVGSIAKYERLLEPNAFQDLGPLMPARGPNAKPSAAKIIAENNSGRRRCQQD